MYKGYLGARPNRLHVQWLCIRLYILWVNT